MLGLFVDLQSLQILPQGYDLVQHLLQELNSIVLRADREEERTVFLDWRLVHEELQARCIKEHRFICLGLTEDASQVVHPGGERQSRQKENCLQRSIPIKKQVVRTISRTCSTALA